MVCNDMALLPEKRNGAAVCASTVGRSTRTSSTGSSKRAVWRRRRRTGQEWRFIVIRKADLRDKVAEAAFREQNVGTAPVIIAACTTNIDYLMPNGQYSYPIDLAMAAAFMALQAEAEGLQSCFVTSFDEQDVKDLLFVPHRMRVVLLLALGFCAGATPQQRRKPLRQIVSYDHW